MTDLIASPTTHLGSAASTRIAVHVTGSGRPLVAVSGTSSEHTTCRLVRPLVEPHLAPHAMDRRGPRW